MAIYRNDQIVFTFGTEAAQGGDPEMAEGTLVGSGGTGALTADTAAGSRTISIDGHSGATFVVGDFIRIGTVAGTAKATLHEHEIRRIEAMQDAGDNSTNTFTLDRPLGFNHDENSEVKEVSAIGSDDEGDNFDDDTVRNDKSKYIAWIPGVFETIDTPDPQMSFEGRRFLGTQSKRNWSVAYPGQQSLSGSVSGIILLNGWPLRFPIGSIVTTPQATSGDITVHADPTATDHLAKKGDVYIALQGTNITNIVAGDWIVIDAGDADKSEVRQCLIENSNVFRLNYPLQFTHDDNAAVSEVTNPTTNYYTHVIKEKIELDTMSWNVHMRDSSETETNDFNRRYVGGMVDSSTISAEEGGMLTMSWDGVQFLNMFHNQENQTTLSTGLYSSDSTTSGMPRYALTQAIDLNDVNWFSQTAATGSATLSYDVANSGTSYPTSEPYYFSEGTIKFFGQEFARIRSFSLSISNSIEPRYYIGRQGARMRGPYETKEGPREYSMSCSVALPDTVGPDSTAQTGATELFKQLLLEGDYEGSTDRTGITATLKFERGTNDYIIIDIPNHTGTAGSPTSTSGINKQGMFINTAPHSISTDNPYQIDLDMMFRSILITIRDYQPFYP